MASRIKIIGIYKITSPSGKIYIGQSLDIYRRFWYYKSLYCKNQRKLYHSLNKHGIDAHTFEIIETCDVKDLDVLEQLYIERFNTFNTENGLNLNNGGNGSRVSEETKKLQSKLWKDYYKNNIDAYNKLVTQLTSIDRDNEKNPNYGTGKRVIQFDLRGKLVKKYISAIEASKELSISECGIYNCCHRNKTQKTCNGYIFKFENDCELDDDGNLSEKIPFSFRKIEQNHKSIFKGVRQSGKKWVSNLYDTIIKKKINLGVFTTELDAARAQNVYLKSRYNYLSPLHEIENPYGVNILPDKIIKTRGVKKNKYHQFESRIIHKGVDYYLGGYYTHKEAAMAYNKKAIELYGSKAVLNII